jgi:penicillin-binding protein 1A
VLDKISVAARNAFIAADDTGYYSHRGVDIKGTLGKLFGDAQSEAYLDSQRTLTQKLIRNQIFVNENNNSFFDELTQMVQEQYLAVKLESESGKEKILEYYLNTLYFGGNRVGIGSASKYYFNKKPKDLSASEAAVLAALAQDPVQYEPVKYQSANSEKRADILSSMLNMDTLSEDEYEDALGDNVYLSLKITDGEKTATQESDTYTEAVISQVISDLEEKEGYSPTQAYHAVYQSGVQIYTCLDGQIQALCEEEISRSLKNKDGQISFVLMEQETGEVKGLVNDQKQTDDAQDSSDSVESVQEAGSILPVLSVWLPAIDTAGKTLGSVVDDTYYVYEKNGVQTATEKGTGYKGLVTLRESILDRLESPAIQMLESMDVQTGYDYLKRLGISTLVDKQEDLEGNVVSDLNLSLAQGELVSGVTNLDLTAAYASLANGGKSVKPLFYTKLVDHNGNVLLENQKEEKQIVKSSSAWLMTDALSQYVSEGDGKDADLEESGFATAGMSGNSGKGGDVWFEGYTPYYTAGIWYGSKKEASTAEESTNQRLWKRIMKKIHSVKKAEQKNFEKPEDIIKCSICTKCGNLAVDGLCDKALGGSTITQEYFVSGTQPLKSCTCHVKYRICTKSEKPATEYCPEKEVEERVYLIKEEESETADSRYTFSKKKSKSRCKEHQ